MLVSDTTLPLADAVTGGEELPLIAWAKALANEEGVLL
jgi:hypothetical protein